MYVKVHVYAGMKKESLKKVKDNTFEIITKAPAERNVANDKVKEVLAEHYGVEKKSIRIISGHHSPSKLLEVIKET